MGKQKSMSSKEKDAVKATKIATTRRNKIRKLKKHIKLHPEDPSAAKSLLETEGKKSEE